MEKKKILVVDDEQDIVNYLCSLLSDHGYETVTAKNGKEGMEVAKKELPHLICLDITMPEESGVRMLRNAQSDPVTSHIPIFIVTGVDSDFETFIKSRKQVKPLQGYFEKPIDKDKFLQEVDKILK